jgi:hypothetical protein
MNTFNYESKFLDLLSSSANKFLAKNPINNKVENVNFNVELINFLLIICKWAYNCKTWLGLCTLGLKFNY